MPKYVYTQRKNPFDISALETPSFVKSYLYHLLAIENKTPKTVLNYYVTIQLLLKWIYAGRPQDKFEMPKDSEIENITMEMIDVSYDVLSGFLAYCGTILENGEDAIKNKVAALKSFYKYFSSVNFRVLESPADLLEMPRCSRKTPVFLTETELYRLKTASFYGQMPERNQCMVALLALCGLRIGELVRLNISDIQESAVRIQGEKAREIQLSQPAINAVNAWLEVRGNYYCIDDEALFISEQKGKRLTERAVQKILQKIFKRAGLNKEDYSAHALRHTAAVNMIKNETSNELEVAKFMGNIAPKTICVYKTTLERAHA